MTIIFQTCVILSIAVIVCASEDIWISSSLFKNNLFDWRFCLAFQPKLKPARVGAVADLAFGITMFRSAVILRLLGSVTATILIFMKSPYVTVPLIFVLAGYFYLFFRLPYALDGADQMTLFVLIGLIIMVQDDGSGNFVRLGATAITLHSAVSYITSGVAKLCSPIWRSGAGFLGIMSSGELGCSLLARFLGRHSRLNVWLSWAVMLAHIVVGATILVGGEVVYVAVVVSALFHIAVALTMRLNNFVWAFGATYPSILFMANWDQRVRTLHDLLGL